MRKSFVVLMLTGLIALISFNAWFFYSSSRDKEGTTLSAPVHLTLLANQSWIGRSFLQKAIFEYEQSTGVQVDIQAVPSNSAASLMKKKFAAGVLPDIVLSSGGAALDAFHPTNNFVNMDDEIWVKNLQPYVLPLVTNNFSVYGFPLWEGALSGIIYNKQIFAKYHLQVPQNEEQFFQVCETLRANGIIPVYMAFRDIWPIGLEYGLDTVVAQDDSRIVRLNRNQLTLPQIPEMLQLLNWYNRLAQSGDLGPSFETNNWDGQADALASGKYAMAIGTDTFLYNELQVNHPGASDDFGLMPFYFGFNERGSYARNDLVAMYVNQKSKYFKEAMDFVDMSANPEKINEIYDGVYTEPLFKTLRTNKLTPEYADVLATGQSDRIVPASANLIIGFSPIDLAVPLQEMMLGETTPEQTLQAIENIRYSTAQNQGTPGF
ncbi:ABC transporter substrate-binding protein [Cohnella silvisoli]|uniref:ABC transporter substrate-binding protein n=1 Tax=Cohnella silvisoli TaxID=2873699 RepID=A0ABV1KZY2_9BACL|nr:ABC transporter substrate-binding protein [Cohnella silvisoli]MCD9024904.1 ABC transporter substrate-binding protein [Cohnella silvisoli]